MRVPYKRRSIFNGGIAYMATEKNRALLTYIKNIVNNCDLHTRRIFDWINKTMFLDLNTVVDDFIKRGKITTKDYADYPCDLCKEIILTACEQQAQKIGGEEHFENRLRWLKSIFNLNKCELEIVKLYADFKRYKLFYWFVSEIFIVRCDTFDVRSYPEILCSSEQKIIKALTNQGSLLRAGILVANNKGYDISAPIYNLLNESFLSKNEMKQVIIGRKETASIPFDRFNFLGNHANFVKNVLENAIKQEEKGVNILFVGEPGTGKTEFAKSLAQEVKFNLYSICDGKNSDEEPNRTDRILALKKSDCALGKDEGILLLDEAEDIFFDDPFRRGSFSKSFINQQLENNIHPIIWTSNTLRGMDNSCLRRFTYILNFQDISEDVRHNMWKTACIKNNIFLQEAEITNLAKSYQVSPAIINTATKNAHLAAGGLEEVKMTLDSFGRALNAKYEIAASNMSAFNASLLNTEINLENLALRLTVAKGPFSLCLYGAAGTGKSAYARYIADKLKMPVLEKRASDLMDKFVGETEKRIAAAFAEAKDKKAMLIFDEADSFLRDRDRAFRSWEVSQVNEMLTWMESHPLPFICSTNLMEGLDKASLRRFTFKIKFDYLSTSQVVMAFAHFFNIDVNEEEVSMLSYLSPGDFVVVKNKANILGCIDDKNELIDMLKTEVEVKGKMPSLETIGFL